MVDERLAGAVSADGWRVGGERKRRPGEERRRRKTDRRQRAILVEEDRRSGFDRRRGEPPQESLVADAPRDDSSPAIPGNGGQAAGDAPPRSRGSRGAGRSVTAGRSRERREAASSSADRGREPFDLRQLELWVHVYEHRYEVLVRTLAIFVIVVGALLALVCREGASAREQAALLGFGAAISLLALWGLAAASRWVRQVEGVLTGLADSLKMKASVSGLRGVLTVAWLLTFLAAVSSLLGLWLVVGRR